MSFSGKLAHRYILTQKRHSIMIILSIIVALTLISSITSLYSTYRSCMLSIARAIDSWHVSVYGLTEEQARILGSDENFSKYEFDNSEALTVTKINYKKNVDDCEKVITNSFSQLNSDYRFSKIKSDEYEIDLNQKIDDKTVLYYINNNLLSYEIIGNNAKMKFASVLSFLLIFIMFVIFSARLVIDTAFEISSKEREKQYGILQSIGASKKHIIKIILNEANILSVIGIPAGIITGTFTSYIIYRIIINTGILQVYYFEVENIENLVSFHVSPFCIFMSIILGYVWILLSAYGTGMRIVRMSPIEAIRSKKNNIIKVKKHKISKMLLGWTGVLSAKNIRRNKKRFFITVLAATISLTLFSSFGYIFKLYEEYADEIFNPDGYDFIITCTENNVCNLSELQSYKHSLDESEYFKNNQLHIEVDGRIDSSYLNDGYKEFLKTEYRSISDPRVMIIFLDKKQYDACWNSNQPIEYSELSKENGFILINQIKNYDEVINKKLNISAGEYIDVSFTNITKLNEARNIKDDIKSNIKSAKEKKSLKISAVSDKDGVLPSYYEYVDCISLIATADQYEKPFVDYMNMTYISSSLNDNADYSSACKFIDDELEGMSIELDNYIERFTVLKTIAAIRILGTALIILISLIALINMANVISTGIINRRGEFSILKSLGMTNFQFRKMVCIECFQYVLISTIAAMIIVLLIILSTVLFVNLIDEGSIKAAQITHFLRSYVSTLPDLSITSIVLFVFGIMVSFFPVRNIEKEGISESIRDID